MNEFNIFNLKVDDIDTHKDEKKAVSDLYSPKADDGKDGVYKALIRFLPNPKNLSKSILRKYVYWLEDQEGKGAYYDSPSTVGEKCPVQDLFFKLRNSESAADRQASEKLKRRNIFYSLIQIVKDPQNPELQGEIKILKYGWQLKKKIDEELNPEFSEPTQVFDLFEGKNFEFIITKQARFNNYDSSKFQGSRSAISLNGQVMARTKENQAKIMEYLNSAPDLDVWDFKAWDDATRNEVMRIVSTYGSHGSNISKVTSKSSGHDLVEELSSSAVYNSTSARSETPRSTPQVEVSEDSTGEDLNDFLEGLDL